MPYAGDGAVCSIFNEEHLVLSVSRGGGRIKRSECFERDHAEWKRTYAGESDTDNEGQRACVREPGGAGGCKAEMCIRDRLGMGREIIAEGRHLRLFLSKIAMCFFKRLF